MLRSVYVYTNAHWLKFIHVTSTYTELMPLSKSFTACSLGKQLTIYLTMNMIVEITSMLVYRQDSASLCCKWEYKLKHWGFIDAHFAL